VIRGIAVIVGFSLSLSNLDRSRSARNEALLDGRRPIAYITAFRGPGEMPASGHFHFEQ
jgi:hypothetical protein